MTRDLFLAIEVAAARGAGLRLSADEVRTLSDDSGILTTALNALTADEFRRLNDGDLEWKDVDPYKARPINMGEPNC